MFAIMFSALCSFADDTIFIAEVVFRVLFMEFIRFLISLNDAMISRLSLNIECRQR
jgi:hypothetical protein